MDGFATAAAMVAAGRLWVGAGLLVAAAFLTVGIERVDPAARGAWAFRPLLAPGIVLLWPLVLWRWAALERRGGAGPAPRPGRAAQLRLWHLRLWTGLALLLPALLLAALLHRPPRADGPPALRLDGPAGLADGPEGRP